MSKVMIFGGTTEGRMLVHSCVRLGIDAVVHVVSGYGKEVLPLDGNIHVITGALTEEEMVESMKAHQVRMVFDATHPYAYQASENIKRACERLHVSRVRVVRDAAFNPNGGQGETWTVSSAKEAAKRLNSTDGNILVTTGSKELDDFTEISGYEERIYARVLPSSEVLAACEELGIRGKHLIAMQGPFSTEMNVQLMKQFDIRYLVTKESGNAGGFREKAEAAYLCDAVAVVIKRPGKEEGITLDQAEELLKEMRTRRAADMQPERSLFLIGTGMGGLGQMTGEAVRAMNSCEILFGAGRMLKTASSGRKRQEGGLSLPHTVQEYAPDRIVAWLKEHPMYRRIGVLYSGDPGFYSGASGLLEILKEDSALKDCRVTVYPGISTLSYLCARAKTGWEDVIPVSLHGRYRDILYELSVHERLFVLLGGQWGVKALCEQLLSAGYDSVRLTVGESLSYPEEQIVQGTPSELKNLPFGSLCAVLMEQTIPAGGQGGSIYG